jgi:antitoxin (DNA-binding transcriptional repressor) of toxin-antitoxin stability system
MKTATVRELRTEFPRIESWLAEGQRVGITKRGKLIATLNAPPVKKHPDFARRFARRRGKNVRVLPSGKGAVDLLIEERGT